MSSTGTLWDTVVRAGDLCLLDDSRVERLRGESAEYLFGMGAVKPYRYLWVGAVVDAANGLMAVPNLISLVAGSGVIPAETRTHAHERTGAE